MLKISAQHNVIALKYGIKEGFKIMAEAGFDAVDLSISSGHIRWEEGFLQDASSPEFAEFFKDIGKSAKECNIEVCMTHAPFSKANVSDPEVYAKVQQQTIRAIYATGHIGSPYIVAHPVNYPDFDNGQNRERGMQVNLQYFSMFVPALKETGVIMCIENLFRKLESGLKVSNAMSKAEDLAELVDTLNEMHGPYFAACLDVGHGVVVGEDLCHMLRVLGQRTRVLHIHDVQGVQEDHHEPGSGSIDWEALMRTLKEVGYHGCFNFETDQYWRAIKRGYFNRQVVLSAAKLLYDMGRALLEIE